MRRALPRSRADLLTTDVSGELVVFDPRSSSAHSLAGAAAAVFPFCDGSTTVEDAAATLQLRVDAVTLAVREIADSGLLETGAGVTRRHILQGGALAAGGALVSSVLIPQATAAASGPGGGGGGGTGGGTPAGAVYNFVGNSPRFGQGASQFAAATGRGLVTGTTLPNGTGTFAVIITELNQQTFSTSQVNDVKSFLSGGGCLVVQGDAAAFDLAPVNGLLSGVGSSMSFDNSVLDGGFQTTTNVSPLAVGVHSVRYAYTSGVTGGTALVTGLSSQVLVAIEKVGGGTVVAVADTNLFSDNSDSGYTSENNGALARFVTS